VSVAVPPTPTKMLFVVSELVAKFDLSSHCGSPAASVVKTLSASARPAVPISAVVTALSASSALSTLSAAKLSAPVLSIVASPLRATPVATFDPLPTNTCVSVRARSFVKSASVTVVKSILSAVTAS